MNETTELGMCDKRQYEHNGPHLKIGEDGQSTPPFPCINWHRIAVPPTEQPTVSLLVRRIELMPDGSIGCVHIGEFAGDRSKDLHLTFAQALTLAKQITEALQKVASGK